MKQKNIKKYSQVQYKNITKDHIFKRSLSLIYFSKIYFHFLYQKSNIRYNHIKTHKKRNSEEKFSDNSKFIIS